MDRKRKTKLRAAARKAKSPRVAAAALGLGLLPETGFVRQPTVLDCIPWSKSTLWDKIKRKEFPAPVKLSKNITAWRAEDIRREIAKLGGQAA